MKNLKRILSVFLAIAVLASCLVALPVFAEETESEPEAVTETVTDSTAAFTDVNKTDKFANAVTVLNKLSIINGYEEANGTFTFKPYNNVTRAEFAALLLRMLGMDQTAAPLVAPFPDVPTSLWAAGTIEAAKNLKIITGYEDGTFGPNNNVSYEEALTMIVRAIGYENYSAPGTEWYSRYVNSAQRLGITKNAVGAVGTPATRSCIAQFIYDTLEVQSRENDEIKEETVMEVYLGLERAEGIIASNGVTSLDSPDVNLRENEIIIADRKTGDTETFRVADVSEYSSMLGATVTYYYKEDKASGYKDVVMFTVKDITSSITIDAEQIDASTALSISYYKSEKASNTTDVSLDANNVVIFNGKLYGNTGEESRFATSMVPTLGSIKLLNTDNDSDYDIVFVDSYEFYAVSSVLASTYTVVDDKITTTEKRTKILNYEDDDQIINFVDINGKKLSFSSIKKNTTSICVKESHNNNGTKMYTVVIINTVSGEVKSKSSDSCTVGSKTYNFSPNATWEAAPEKGGSYTFFLDINGDIVAYTKDETAAASSTYGYITNYGRERGDSGLDNSPVKLVVLTQSNSKAEIYLHKSTKINDAPIGEDYEGAIATLEETAAFQAIGYVADEEEGLGEKGARQLIKYTTKTAKINGETKTVFDTIVTVTDESDDDTEGGDADAEVLRMYGGFDRSDDNVQYKTSPSRQFKSGSNTVYYGSAIVFVVPDNMSDSSAYRKGSSSDFRNGNNYNIEVFDMSKTSNAKVIVLYGGNSTTEVDSTTPLFRVKEYYEEENPNNHNESMLKIIGYKDAATSTTEYWVSPSSEDRVETLAEGDIVRFGTDADGFVTLAAENILYKTGKSAYIHAWNDNYKDTSEVKEMPSPDIKIVYGTLYSTEDDTVIVASEFLGVDEEIDAAFDATDETTVLRLDASKFSSTKFYQYDIDNGEAEITEVEEGAAVLETLDTFTETEDSSAAKVFVYLRDGSVKFVLIIND